MREVHLENEKKKKIEINERFGKKKKNQKYNFGGPFNVLQIFKRKTPTII